MVQRLLIILKSRLHVLQCLWTCFKRVSKQFGTFFDTTFENIVILWSSSKHENTLILTIWCLMGLVYIAGDGHCWCYCHFHCCVPHYRQQDNNDDNETYSSTTTAACNCHYRETVSFRRCIHDLGGGHHETTTMRQHPMAWHVTCSCHVRGMACHGMPWHTSSHDIPWWWSKFAWSRPK